MRECSEATQGERVLQNMYLMHDYEYHWSYIHGSCYTCTPSGHQVTLMWESVIKFQQMHSSRYGQTLSLQVWLTACSPIVGRLEYGLLSEHAHKHTYACDSSQTPGTMNNDFCHNNTCYIVLLHYYGTLYNIPHKHMRL